MKLKVIDCKYLFTKDYIEEIKDQIKSYNQGFIVIAGTLYLPYYQVLRIGYTLPLNAETTVIDIDDTINSDNLSKYFNSTNSIDVEDIIDLYHVSQLNDDFGELLDVVDQISISKYEEGFADGGEY